MKRLNEFLRYDTFYFDLISEIENSPTDVKFYAMIGFRSMKKLTQREYGYIADLAVALKNNNFINRWNIEKLTRTKELSEDEIRILWELAEFGFIDEVGANRDLWRATKAKELLELMNIQYEEFPQYYNKGLRITIK